MNIEKLLEYQKKDEEIFKLEKKLESSEDKRIYQNMEEHAKEAQNKSVVLEKQASMIAQDYEKLKKTFEDNQKYLDSLEKKVQDNLSEDELKERLELSNSILSNLNILEKKMMNIASNINAVLTQFNDAKARYQAAKTKYKEHKEKYEALRAEIEPKVAEIKKELETLEKGIDKRFMDKYKQKRADKNFPIFVTLRDKFCSGCAMELPSANLGKLKQNGFLECENCRRIIYYEDK